MCTRLSPSALCALVVLALPLRPSAAGAWGERGHHVVALIATDRLTPHAAAEVAAILANDPEHTGTALVDVSLWPDEVRFTTMPETYDWHFVDIPVTAPDQIYDAGRDCGMHFDKNGHASGDCVIKAMEREVATLKNPSASASQRANALKFVTHLVGDVHQPLHSAERQKDSGGNDVKVRFFGALKQPGGNKKWNLHAVWDAGLIAHTQRSDAQYVQAVEKWIKKQDADAVASGTTTDWANEAHHLATTHAYRSASGKTSFPKTNGAVGPKYYQANIAIVDEQLGKAGVRLAKVLNDAFP